MDLFPSWFALLLWLCFLYSGQKKKNMHKQFLYLLGSVNRKGQGRSVLGASQDPCIPLFYRKVVNCYSFVFVSCFPTSDKGIAIWILLKLMFAFISYLLPFLVYVDYDLWLSSQSLCVTRAFQRLHRKSVAQKTVVDLYISSIYV